MTYRLILALVRRYSGRDCRSCGEPLSGRDEFGVSEGICAACRG